MIMFHLFLVLMIQIIELNIYIKYYLNIIIMIKLYDNKLKKIIKTNINLDTKKKLINNEYRILTKKEDKNYDINKIKKLISNDDNYLPLYDIKNNKFYYIYKKDVFYLIKDYSFRPINDSLRNIIKDKINKDILNIFDFDILEKLLLKFVYYNTKSIGEEFTIIKNPAYIKLLDINPFLKKSSIINTALNIGILKIKNLPIDDKKLKSIYNKIYKIF